MMKTNAIFSFHGRINRARYWLLTIAGYVVLGAAAALASAVADSDNTTLGTGGVILAVIVIIIALVALVSAKVRRFHDRDKSGLWVLIGLVPWIGGIWIFVECGCLRGTPGPNAHGPDPLRPFDAIGAVFDAGAPALEERRG